MEDEKFYTCKYDRPFKEIMLDEKNKDILRLLLESILKVEISNIEIKPTERNTGNLKIKRKNLDALLYTSEGKIGIEVNAHMEDYVRPRNMGYISDIYAHHTLVGETYDEETMIMQINLTYGLYKDGDKERFRVYYVQDSKSKKYVKNLKIIEFNMDYYKEIWKKQDKKLIEENKYLVMLDLELEDLKKLSKTNRMVNKYMESLETINKNPEFREYMSKEEDERKIKNTIERKFQKIEKELNDKAEEINKKTNEVNNRESEISNRENEVNNRENEVNNRENEVNNRENEVNNRENEVNNRENEVNVKEQLVISKQEELTKREKELFKKQTELSQEQTELLQRQNKFIKNMIDSEIDIDKICEITGLSKDEIDKICPNSK